MTPKGGSVVLLSTAAAHIRLGNHEAISAAKGRLPRPPPRPRNKSGSTVWSLQNEMMAKASAGMHASDRTGEPDDVAPAIESPLDAEPSWITGQVMGIDGGLSRIRSRSWCGRLN